MREAPRDIQRLFTLLNKHNPEMLYVRIFAKDATPKAFMVSLVWDTPKTVSIFLKKPDHFAAVREAREGGQNR